MSLASTPSAVQASACNDAEAEAYIHTWNLVGHQLGIRSDLLPLDWADSEAIWEHIKARAYAESDAGRELTAAAIECMRDLIRIGPLGGLPASGIRHYLGDQTAQLLGVPKADWTRWFFTFVQVSDTLFDRTWARLPGVPNLSAALGLRMLGDSSSPSAMGTDRASKLPMSSGRRGEWGTPLDPPVDPRGSGRAGRAHAAPESHLNRSCSRCSPALTFGRT